MNNDELKLLGSYATKNTSVAFSAVVVLLKCNLLSRTNTKFFISLFFFSSSSRATEYDFPCGLLAARDKGRDNYPAY